MSIKDYPAEVEISGLQYDSASPGDYTTNRPARRHRLRVVPGRTRSYIPLLFCLAIALIMRTWLVIHTQGFIDGDEALVGIQAEHILHGEFPFYFYNQPYMGSLEAYLVALIFAIVGPSVLALRAEPILLSLAVVWLTWKLAAELAESAHLPPHAKRWFMTISALLAAIPPLYDTVLELRTLGGYIETFLLMLLLLLSALKLTRRRKAGASSRELAWRWAAIGFIVGLGDWVDPLIVYAILAAALWIGWDFLVTLNRGRSGSGRVNGLLVAPRVRSLALPALAALPACIVGLAPAITWGVSHQWQNLTYLLHLSGDTRLSPEILAHYPTRPDIFFGLVHLYTTCVAPRVISGALPGESHLLAFLHAPTLFLGLFCMLATGTCIAMSLVRPSPSLLRIRQLAALPFLFAACITIIYCVTKTAATGLWSCQYDIAGRYATPLMLVLPFLFATPFTALVMLEADRDKVGSLVGSGQGDHKSPCMGRFLGTGCSDSRGGSGEVWGGGACTALGRGLVRSGNVTSRGGGCGRCGEGVLAPPWGGGSGHDVQSQKPTPESHKGRPYARATLGFLVGILLVALYLQVFSYGLNNAGSTFQSPYCTFVPANDNAIIAYMQREHIQYAWAINWIAYPIVFKTHGSIILADPLPFLTHNPVLNRIPANSDAVLHSDRPSLITFVRHNDLHPKILRLLDSKQVTYRIARFPAQEGRDVIVVTPLSRTVSPFEPGPFYNIFICSRDS